MSVPPKTDAERELIDLAARVLPAGSFGNFPTDIVIRDGRGGRVWDVSGNEYVDFLLGSGPMFVGNGHPEVLAAVTAQISRGYTFFANNEYGIRLAAEIVGAVPCAEQVRFTSSGTEADAYALRLARAYRKRDKILKFEGAFHGMSDYALMSYATKRPGNFPQASPDSAGIPRSVQGEVMIAPFNDAAIACQLIREHRHELAGVIMEPLQRVIAPVPGFLQAIREVCTECEIPLIFDEVVTGFRFAWGGAQQYYGVTPDICTLGKIIGGGFPLAAVAGRSDIMAHFDKAKAGDEGFMPQIGTLSGNPVAAVAGLATLQVLKQPGTYEKVFATGRTLMEGISKIHAETGLMGMVVGEPPMFDVAYASSVPRDYRAILRANEAMQKRINQRLRAGGVLRSDSKYYVSLAHDAADVEHTLNAYRAAAKAELMKAAAD
jgi:glutamate-1-semialdehyde 2,1-aminomutase